MTQAIGTYFIQPAPCKRMSAEEVKQKLEKISYKKLLWLSQVVQDEPGKQLVAHEKQRRDRLLEYQYARSLYELTCNIAAMSYVELGVPIIEKSYQCLAEYERTAELQDLMQAMEKTYQYFLDIREKKPEILCTLAKNTTYQSIYNVPIQSVIQEIIKGDADCCKVMDFLVEHAKDWYFPLGHIGESVEETDDRETNQNCASDKA